MFSGGSSQERRPQLEGIATLQSNPMGSLWSYVGKKTSIRRDCDAVLLALYWAISSSRKEDLNQKGLRLGLQTIPYSLLVGKKTSIRRDCDRSARRAFNYLKVLQERRPQLEGIATLYTTLEPRLILKRRKEDLNQKGLRRTKVLLTNVSYEVGKKTSIRRDCDPRSFFAFSTASRRKEDLNQKGLRQTETL